jgi:ABC-2 type transport system permease protein
MKRILDITLKDLTELSRNRMTFLFFLIMPVAFTLLFGLAFSGNANAAKDNRLPVGFIDQDGSPLSLRLAELLGDSTVFRQVEDPKAAPADLEQQVADEDLAAALIIPAGYGQAALSGASMKLTLIVDASALSGMTIQNDALAIASRLSDAVRTARIATGVGGDPAAFDPALEQALSAWNNPPVRVMDTTPNAAAETDSTANAFSHSSPGMMLQFAIAGLLTCAQIIVSERKNRCLQRILTTSTSRVQILLGHYFAIVLLLLAQFILLALFGQFALGLDYLAAPLAALLMILTTALCIGALGLLIGVLARSEEQAIMFSLLPMFILSALGGAWVPLDVTGETFKAIGHLSPVAWSMDGFANILSRSLGMHSVLLPAAALMGYAALFFLLAAWRFRRVSE